MGPSPEEGSVWAFASSSAASPLLIDAPWEVWDGEKVVLDYKMQVSDTSVVPSVLFLSLGEGVPQALRSAQGMLLQQPGLWDGRPYYKHRGFEDLYLLCSVAEGRWRLGPLQGAAGRSSSTSGIILFSKSAAALPTEIAEAWMVPSSGPGGADQLPQNAVRLDSHWFSRATVPMPQRPPVQQHPRHLVVEGVAAGDGAANGVYRLASEQVNHRPLYHKTDALRTSSLWFTGADWRLGPSIEDGRVWAYASIAAESPLGTDARWLAFDGRPEEDMHIADASQAIPASLVMAGTRFVQEDRLCDARPVYRRAEAEDLQEGSGASREVFLFFRAHESEWWIGPQVGGTECLAKAKGSLQLAIPRPDDLQWIAASAPRTAVGAESKAERADWDLGLDELQDPTDLLAGLVLSTAALGLILWAALRCPNSQEDSGGKSSWKAEGNSLVERRSGKSRSPELACVVCLEAPRQILLMPCRHVCCCKVCAQRLERCPICRAETTTLAEVFL